MRYILWKLYVGAASALIVFLGLWPLRTFERTYSGLIRHKISPRGAPDTITEKVESLDNWGTTPPVLLSNVDAPPAPPQP